MAAPLSDKERPGLLRKQGRSLWRWTPVVLYVLSVLILMSMLHAHYRLLVHLRDGVGEMAQATDLAVQAQDVLASERAMVGQLDYALTARDERIMRERLARSLPNFRASYVYFVSLEEQPTPQSDEDVQVLLDYVTGVRDLALDGKWQAAEMLRQEMEPTVKRFEARMGTLSHSQRQHIVELQRRFLRYISYGLVYMLIAFVLIIGLAVLNVFLMRRRMREASSRVVAITSALRRGEFQARFSLPLWLAEDPWVGRAMRAINELAATLEARFREIAARRQEAEKALQDVLTMIEGGMGITHPDVAAADPARLYARLVSGVAEQFDLLHVAIYSMDEQGEYLILRAASSERGKEMLARHYRVRVGEGLVGYVARHREPYLGGEGQGMVRLRDAEFPETRAYLVVPLIAHGDVMGVLEVRCSRRATFPRHVAVILEAVAGRIAMLMDNARLYEEVDRLRRELSRLYGELAVETWRALLGGVGRSGYRYLEEGGGVEPIRVWSPEMRRVVEDDRVLRRWTEGAEQLIVPLHSRGLVVGVVAASRREGWTPQWESLFRQLASHLEISMESALLFAESQMRAARERVLSELAAQFSQAFDMQVLLENAVRELGQRFQLEDVSIFIGPPEGGEGAVEEAEHGEA